MNRVSVLLIILSFMGCTNLFFLPERDHYLAPSELGLEYEDRFIEVSPGERIHSWYLPAVGVERGLVLFFHGNAQNISTHIAAVAWLPAQGYSVLLPDYRGYGISDGKADYEQAQVDVRRMLDYAQQISDNVVVLGQSLGGALALYGVATLPDKRHIRGVIAESPFSSYRLIAREKIGDTWLGFPVQFPLSFLVSDRYSPVAVVSEISPLPLLFIHGENDEVVPYHHSEKLYAAAREPKSLFTIPNGTHTSSAHYPPAKEAILKFLSAVMARSL